MAIKGSLKEASLADVCQLLALGQKTGCLSVSDQSKFGQIFFDAGKITFATVVNRRERLGDMLIRDGLLTHEQLNSILGQQARRPGQRLGELLVAEGLISRAQLERYIRRQIEETIYHLFTWSQGSFFFEVDARPAATEMLVRINAESVLLEGARRVDEWSLIEKKIPSLDLVFQVDRAHLGSTEVELTEEQKRIIPMLDGSASVQDVIDEMGLSEFEVGSALFGLIQAGFAHRVGRLAAVEAVRTAGAEVAEHMNLGIALYRTGMLAEASREFRQVLDLQPDDVHARFHLALVALRERRDREAARRLQALLEATGPRFAAFVDLAVALRRLGRPDDALLVLDEAEKVRAGEGAVMLNRAVIHLDMGDVDAAHADLAEYRRRLGAATPSAIYYYHAVLTAALGGRLEDAERLVQEALAAHPSSAPLHLLAGAVAERRGDLALAEERYRRGAEEDPTLVQAQKNLGDVAYRTRRHDDALEHFHRAIELAPDLGDDVYAKLGNLHYKRLERQDAVRYWKRAIELNPANEVVKTNLEAVENALG